MHLRNDYREEGVAMRRTLIVVVAALAGFGCSDSSPTAPFADGIPAPSEARSAPRVEYPGLSYRSFTLALAAGSDSPSEAWGLFVVRAGLAPPNPCSLIARRSVSAVTVCGIVYNPAEERLDAVTLEVTYRGAELPTVFRGYVSAPPSPCDVAILRGVFPAELAQAESVAAVLETDQGTVVSGGGHWPGAFPASPLRPCSLTVTLG
jgi:hypothetical protein